MFLQLHNKKKKKHRRGGGLGLDEAKKAAGKRSDS